MGEREREEEREGKKKKKKKKKREREGVSASVWCVREGGKRREGYINKKSHIPNDPAGGGMPGLNLHHKWRRHVATCTGRPAAIPFERLYPPVPVANSDTKSQKSGVSCTLLHRVVRGQEVHRREEQKAEKSHGGNWWRPKR